MPTGYNKLPNPLLWACVRRKQQPWLFAQAGIPTSQRKFGTHHSHFIQKNNNN